MDGVVNVQCFELPPLASLHLISMAQLFTNLLRFQFEASPNEQNSYFGQCSLLMFGDFGQLPPVGDIPLFDLRPREGRSDNVLEANNGRDAYLSLSENIALNCIM